MVPREAIYYSMKSLRRRMGRHKIFTTHRTSCRRVWRRGLGALNSSPHSWILLPFQWVSVLAPLRFLPLRCANRCSHWTKVWRKNYPTCDAPLLIWHRRCAAQLFSVTEIALPEAFLCVNNSSIRHDVRGGAKPIRCSVNIASKKIIVSLTYLVSSPISNGEWCASFSSLETVFSTSSSISLPPFSWSSSSVNSLTRPLSQLLRNVVFNFF